MVKQKNKKQALEDAGVVIQEGKEAENDTQQGQNIEDGVNDTSDDTQEVHVEVQTPQEKSDDSNKSEDPIEETEQQSATKEEIVEIPEYAENILKLYPQYETLYISKQGGAFTSPVSAKRANAVKYKNPFYKKRNN